MPVSDSCPEFSTPLAVFNTVVRPIVARCTRASIRGGADLDDLVQEASIEGYLASGRWSPEGGASLATFVAYRVAGACADARRRHARQSFGGEVETASDVPLQDELVAAKQRADRLTLAIDELHPRTRVLVGLVLEGVSATNAAESVGISKSRASRLLASAASHLRQQLELYASN